MGGEFSVHTGLPHLAELLGGFLILSGFLHPSGTDKWAVGYPTGDGDSGKCSLANLEKGRVWDLLCVVSGQVERAECTLEVVARGTACNHEKKYENWGDPSAIWGKKRQLGRLTTGEGRPLIFRSPA